LIRISDLNIIETITIVKGDSFTITVNVTDDNGNPIDLTNLHCRAVIKILKEVYEPDDKAILKFSSCDNTILKNSEGLARIIITPEQSMKLPIVKTSKPLIVSLTVFNKDIQFRKEYQFALVVKQNAVYNVY